ncbi:glycerophosphodiester phosphodiesterase [Paenibacillus cremeus]|uniref:Glycerophosphodiester phosphodiesterase n=1 Tax=Paenibacillus cremeus TaxID=2163881 RepID=A0A559KC64_9BACL|nr:glycerophosphodiester phosphodiesterase [Paenibacillus cremeus]TVY09726.1 glycerophosphodiester phosphodiesterase [Paenibacillus cremeus]
MTIQSPLIIAHRGAAGEAPENTLAAFQLAVEQGCHAIELDVHLSKDGEVIVCHDATVNRTTDGIGTIHDMTVEQLKTLDAGRWFDEKYEGERLPLLSEVFDLVPRHIMINVEIKGSYNRQLEPALIRLMQEYNRVDTVVISSFDHKSLLFAKLIEPMAKIGLLYDVNAVRHAALADLLGTNVYSLHPNFKRIDKAEVQDAISQGLQVYPYTLNDEKRMKQAIEYGVSGIITDFPARLRALLASPQAVK